MAGDGKIHMPGGMGGLMRYDEEYQSRFMIKPSYVIAFAVFVLVLVIGMKIVLS